ncbi:type II toxin-antitoxin system RelE/ParE family toxin [Gloeocapsopsis sp. IPPAS B-1203]|uniref:type II toxin-antitoxin system RelE/ParE family toxin n=1 Tax=Gloeocapsopsis sp. IPPAS B-1203 TaxID=2049454 RepID=UPI000C17914D|nr:type II toxin-antitoxin system RelE/ParE family toxin [Gloeocapsopsis sp. IPPAS B-1203]PIG92895.1 plasmid maintenance system killer protein [Gloeocapsopsis sp. IPPAS B-1203]
MILSFKDESTKDVFDGLDTKKARKVCPQNLLAVARRKLDAINAATNLNDLRVPPKNYLESLSGDRLGQHSIRIDDQYRICFVWTEQGAEEVEIVDYH